jgi:hypothetical protein
VSNWKFKPDDRVSWETSGHGSNKRSGVIKQCLPAGEAADFPLSPGILPISQVDRYVVETPRLGKNGPVSTGKMDIMAPNRWQLEKNAVLEANS